MCQSLAPDPFCDCCSQQIAWKCHFILLEVVMMITCIDAEKYSVTAQIIIKKN